ncbi:MAG: glycosyltransferase family 2 protein [Aquabacterium sp.]|nr:glycosyltransferase family 2 protein [Aquabacterium sp.]
MTVTQAPAVPGAAAGLPPASPALQPLHQPVPQAAEPDVSIVVPMFNEVDNLVNLVERIGAAMAATAWQFELIAVDDGSTDGTAALLRQLAQAKPWLQAVCLARNYGQSSALQAGFDRVRGRYVVTLDADLQNEPLDIPALLQRLEDDAEVDMVSGWRVNRQDKALSRRLPSLLANRLISRATGVQLHDYGCALKAYRRPIIDRIRLFGELHRFIPSLARDAGARIAEVPVRHHARTHGQSKYGIDRTFRVILDLVLIVFFMRYRQRPLHAFGGLGLWLLAPGLGILGYLLVVKLGGQDIGGRPLLITGVLLLLIGVQLIVAGLVGEMLTRIYHEGSGRPQYHLRHAAGLAAPAASAGSAPVAPAAAAAPPGSAAG